jgi:HK97 family phage prohead protease
VKLTREYPLEVLDVTRAGAEGDGRTLVARALTYNRPEPVSDDGGKTVYVEEWRPGVFAKSLRLRGARLPLLTNHDRRVLPVGGVHTWEDSPSALGFTARLADTTGGRDVLELVDMGVLRGVSVGAEPITSLRTPTGVARIEAKLLEISLTAFPQLAGAEVLAVRHEILDDDPDVPAPTPLLDTASAWLDGLDGPG